jgi:hypothetical protein
MTTIKDVTKDGFALGDTGLALLSLKLSLKAYFSTYKSMKYSLHVFSPEYEEYGLVETSSDYLHSSSYVENCSEAIVHFHHFVELVCKDILREEHTLLADFTSSRHHIILYKLLSGEQISDEDEQKLQSVAFREALERLNSLVKERKINNSGQWEFFRESYDWLVQLSYLRNRLVHRGVFVLRYPALDKLFGEYALPFVKNVIASDKYSGKDGFWKYTGLKCGIDPIELIIEECQDKGDDYRLGKVAFLKELGRAAYEQPKGIIYKAKDIGSNKYRPFGLDFEHQQRAVRIAKSETSNVSEVRECPVCGIPSLVVYDDIELEGEDFVNHHLKNPREYNIPLDDFWYGEELT